MVGTNEAQNQECRDKKVVGVVGPQNNLSKWHQLAARTEDDRGEPLNLHAAEGHTPAEAVIRGLAHEADTLPKAGSSADAED